MEYGGARRVTRILDNGKWAKLMDMEYMFGETAIDMKVNGEHVSETATGLTSSQTTTNILANIVMGIPTASDNINGLTETHMLESFLMEWSMERESGERSQNKTLLMTQEKQREYAINLKVSTEEIKKTAMENSIGRVEMSLKETIKRISVKVMVKCTG
jgi:hypothetical protein